MKKLFTSIAMLFIASAMFAQVSVTFNVDMTGATAFKAGDPIFDPAVTFDPALHDVFIAGSGFGADWAQPGTNLTLEMLNTTGNIFSINFPAVAAGPVEYKFFFVPIGGSSWNGGEWEGGANRTLTVGASAIIVDKVWGQISGVSEVSKNYSVYPNPSTGVFTVNSDQNYSLEVVNVIGKTVLKQDISASVNNVDLTKQSKGMYFFKLTSGNATSIQKVLVK